MTQEQTSFEQKGFAGLDRLTSGNKNSGRMARHLMGPLLKGLEREDADWVKDAEYSILESKESGARSLLYVVALVFVLLLLWASLASIDEVARGEGKVIPASQLQVVQSSDGGVIEEILVREGDRVAAGDLLVRLDPTRSVSSFQETEVRIFALQMKVERLKALLQDDQWEPPIEVSHSAQQAAVLARELEFYAESVDELAQRMAIAREQLSQQERALQEVRARERAAGHAVRLLTQEIGITRPMLASGAVSEVELLRLERDLTNATGELQRSQADIQRQLAAVDEAQARMAEARHTARNRWRTELGEAAAELSGLQEGSVALADRVRSAELLSPVSGTVQRVLFSTTGGVISPGEAVVEIVPADDRLLIEARIAPRDIAFLRPGLPATVKLHAYDFAIYGGIPAQIQHISADTITDHRDNTYYLVRAITEELTLSNALEVVPGMTAQLDIITGERTVLAYLLKPILRAKENALGER